MGTCRWELKLRGSPRASCFVMCRYVLGLGLGLELDVLIGALPASTSSKGELATLFLDLGVLGGSIIDWIGRCGRILFTFNNNP